MPQWQVVINLVVERIKISHVSYLPLLISLYIESTYNCLNEGVHPGNPHDTPESKAAVLKPVLLHRQVLSINNMN